MKIFAETERLILREIMPSDKGGMFELDADPEVHRYLGNKPVKNRKQAADIINFIRQQYIDNGIGRWAIIEKSSKNFLGWAGLKLVTEMTNNHADFYDLGYRLIKKHWGKGFATESAHASLDYGFKELNLTKIYAMADIKNTASRIVLEKCGLRYMERFDLKGITHDWMEITRNDWAAEMVSPSAFLS